VRGGEGRCAAGLAGCGRGAGRAGASWLHTTHPAEPWRRWTEPPPLRPSGAGWGPFPDRTKRKCYSGHSRARRTERAARDQVGEVLERYPPLWCHLLSIGELGAGGTKCALSLKKHRDQKGVVAGGSSKPPSGLRARDQVVRPVNRVKNLPNSIPSTFRVVPKPRWLPPPARPLSLPGALFLLIDSAPTAS